jgi:hypothetical protein
MNRLELLTALVTCRENFLEFIDDLPDEALVEAGVNGNWSVKDILAHLTRWEAELVKLLWQVKLGQTPTSAQFSKQSVDELNDQWFREMRSRPLDRILEDFHGVRTQTARRVEAFSDKDLEDGKRFVWAGGRALWEWVASDSFEHEAEHAEQIHAWRVNKGFALSQY